MDHPKHFKEEMTSPMPLHFRYPKSSPQFNCRQTNHYMKPARAKGKLKEESYGRRFVGAAIAATALFLQDPRNVASFELRLTVPDQTPEEADAVVKIHAKDLIKIKSFIDSQSWKEAQLAIRESSSYLKQDLYTIIQAKPGKERPQLRKLYSTLFNNVSMLDYAARDKDAKRVQECYRNILSTLNEIFAKI